jgi:hypothetical protein
VNRFAILGAMGIAVIVAALLLNYVINRDELGDSGSTPTPMVAIAPSGASTGAATAPAAGNAGSGGTGTAATGQGAITQGATIQGASPQGQPATNNETAATGGSGATTGTAGQAAAPAATGGNSTASSAAAAPTTTGSSATGTGGNSATDQASTGAAATAAPPASTAPANSATTASPGTPANSGTTAGAGNATVATTEPTNQGAAATANGNNAGTGTAAAAAPPPPVIRPSFDVVRVNPDGSTIIAGRAAPHSTVTITADGQKAATVVADDRGEWVILPPDKLAPGNHQIGITSVLGGAPPVPSDDMVVVVVPQPQVASNTTAAAGGTQTAAAAPPQQPLAVVVPRTDQGSTVLQSPNPPQSGQLILESVDYDSKGRVVIGGRAGPGKEVRAYLDNGLMGMTRADGSGRWHITPDKPVLPGLHTLRIDEVDDAGKVLARVESPFSRAEPLSIGAGDQVVVVQPGNNLWLIATRTYGSGLRYTVIYQANKSQIQNPDLIYPGQVFKLPTATP